MSVQSSSLYGGASKGCCAQSAQGVQNNYSDSVRRAADANGDGTVSKSEAKDFFRKADRNGDGKVSAEEMLRSLLDNSNKAQESQSGGGCGGGGKGGGSPSAAGGAGKPSGGSPSQGASGCGGGDKAGGDKAGGCGTDENKLDADGDGNITIEELERFMNASRNQDNALATNKAGATSDANGDGSLSLREFMKSMQACA